MVIGGTLCIADPDKWPEKRGNLRALLRRRCTITLGHGLRMDVCETPLPISTVYYSSFQTIG
jgi:hypothetical protein